MGLYGLILVKGRNFLAGSVRNNKTVLLNEDAIRLMGFKDPASTLNVPINFWGDTLDIVGVVKNYHQEGLRVAQEPIIFR